MSHDHAYIWRELIDGVLVIGFVPRGADDQNPDATYDRDVAEVASQLKDLDSFSPVPFVVVDFENYKMTWENGRAVVSLVLNAHRRLAAKSGGVAVCNHPAQFNPDLQKMFQLDKVIDIYRTRQQAIEAVRARMQAGRMSNK